MKTTKLTYQQGIKMKTTLHIINAANFAESYAVYILYKEGDEFPYYIGSCLYQDVMKIPDARAYKTFDHNAKYAMHLFEPMTRTQAKVKASELHKHLQGALPALIMNEKTGKPQIIICNETERLFLKQSDVHTVYGIPSTTICKLLKNYRGFKTAQGKSFQYITCTEGKVIAELSAGVEYNLEKLVKLHGLPVIVRLESGELFLNKGQVMKRYGNISNFDYKLSERVNVLSNDLMSLTLFICHDYQGVRKLVQGQELNFSELQVMPDTVYAFPGSLKDKIMRSKLGMIKSFDPLAPETRQLTGIEALQIINDFKRQSR